MNWIRLAIAALFIPFYGKAQLTASFTTSPAANNNTITICQGSTVLYTNTSTGTNASTNYNWTFQGGNPASSNTIGPHNVAYANPGNYTTTLNLGNGVTSQVSVNVVASNYSPSLTIPNNSGFSTTSYGGITIFRRCSNFNSGNFSFTDPAFASYPAGTTFNFIWGDGTPNGNGNPTPITHLYASQGYYNFTYQVTFPGGCTFTHNYLVYVGNSPPPITITGSGSSSCLPSPYSFSLGTPNSPTAGTTFQIIYNDGTPTTTLNGLNPNPQTINHVFAQTSCGINSVIQQQTYTNAYSIQVVAFNGCNPQGTFAAIGPIAAGGSVNAVVSANPNTNVICVNQPITFNDVSNHGTNVYGGSCDSTFGRYWTISPNSGFTTAGTLGNPNGYLPNTQNGYDWGQWANGSASLPVTWTVPGNYQVVLHLGNDCGMDSAVYNICVVAATVANFTLPQATACAPVNITPTNTSSTPGCNLTNVFNWAVTSTNPQNCNFNGGPSVQPANSALANPTFNFNGPGVYTIQLTVGLSNQVAGASCAQSTFSQQITIKGPPQFSINPVGPICAGGTISPTIVMNNCYATSPNTYAWNFNPGGTIPAGSIPNPTSANTLNPGTITYPSSTGSPFPFNLTATNECGPTTVSSTVVVNTPVVVTPGNYGPFCLNTPVPLNGSVSGGVATGYWTANVAGGSFNPVGSGGANSGALNATYTPPAGYNGNIILTLTSGQPPAPCPVATAQTTITFNPIATASAGVYPNGACMNGTLALNGSIGGAASSATWTSSVGGTFTPNANALNANWAPPANFTGVATLTLTTDDPAGPCNPAVATINVTVHPLPVATAPQTVGPICSGSNAVINVSSTINPSTFAWTASLPAGVAGTASGTLNSGSNAATLTTALTNNTNAPQTVTYTFTPSSNGCPGAPVTTQVVVQPVATTGPFQPITVCPGATITPPVFTSNPAGATFGWVNSNVNIGTAASGAGQMSPWTAPANNTNTAIAANIAVTPTFNNCPGTPASFVISINPTPSIVNTPTAQTRCSGVATAAVGFATSVAGTTVAWTGVASSGTVTGFTPSGTGGLPVMTITNSSNTPQTVTYTVIPTRNGCQGPPFTYTITINPTPVLTLSANQTICGGQTTSVSAYTNSVAGGTFAYALQNPGSVPATITGHPTNGNGQIPAATINNSGTNPYTLNYTITPSANSCNGTTATYSITVNPAPVTTFSQGNQTICTGQNTTLVNLSSTTPNVTFAWSLQGAVPAGLGNFNPTSGTSSIPVYTNLTNNTPAPITVTLQAQATTAGAAQCPGALANYTITVNPSPIVAANFVSNDTVCSGQSVNIALSSTTAGTTFTWTAANGAGVTGGQNSAAPSATINQALSNSSSAVGSVTYTITPNASSCNGAPLQVLAFVNPVATISALASPTVCPAATITPTAFVSTPNGASFAWTNTNTAIGIGASGNGQISPWSAPANNTNAAITGTVTVTPTYNGCTGTPSNFTVTINPTPTVTNNTLAQSLCSGSSTTAVAWTSNLQGTTYAWTGVASAGTVTGFTASGTGNLPVMQITNSSNAAQTVTYTVTPTRNGCSGPAVTYTITVNPIPQVTLSQNQTVCGGVATVASSFVNSVAGGSFTYALQNPNSVPNTITGYPTSGNGQVPASTITNSGTNPYTLTYTITPTANGCSGATANFSLTINPAPVTTFAPGNQTICSGQNTNLVTLGSSTAGVTFTWSIPGGVPAGMGNVNVTSGTSTIPAYQNLTNNTNAPLVLTIVAVATTGGASQCAGSPSNYTITVNPVPTALATFISNDTICSNTALNISLSATTPNTSFSWTAVNGPNTTGGANSVNPGNTIQQTLVNSSTNFGSVTYTITPVVAGACQGSPIQVMAYVNPVATIAALNSPTVCPQATITPTAFVSTPVGASFAWANNNINIGLAASGNGQINPWTAPANNTNAAITGTVTVTPTFNGCAGTPSNFTVTINPTPTVTNNSLSQTLCSGTSTTAVTWTSNVANTTYAWTGVANSPNVNGFTPSGSGNLPVMTITNSSNTPQTVTYTVTPTRNGCSGPAVTYIITVNPTPVLTLSANQTICGGQTTSVSAYTNSVAGGTFAYALQNPGSVPATITGHPTNGNGQIPAATINNSGTNPYTLNYTITPSANSCIGTTASYSITVNPAPVTTFSQGNQTICTGQNTTLVNLSSTTPNVTFAWSLQGAVPAGLGNFNPTSGTSSIPVYTNLTNNTPAPITVTLQAQATTAGAAQCPGALANYTITVNPSPIVAANFVSNDTVCSGQSVNIALSSTTAGTTFTWTAANGAGVTGGQNSAAPSATINQALSNSSSAVGSVTYTITPNASSCNGAPLQVLAFVNPVATISALASPTVCPAATITPTAFVSTPNSASFAWTNTNTAIGIGASGNGQISPWSAPANNTNAAITGTVTVTPTYNGCTGTPSNFTVTINPTPTVTNNTLAQSLCSGSSTTAVAWTSNLQGTTYAWTGVASAGTVTGFTASGTGNLPVMQITNSSNAVQTVTYTVTPTSNGCSGPAVTYTITVNPIPQVTLSQNQTVCGGVATVASSFVNSVAGGSFTFALQNPNAVPNTVSGFPTSGNGQVPVATITNSGTNPYTLTYTITPTANGCNGATGNYTITVNPAPTVTFSQGNQTVCNGGNSQQVTINSTTANTTFSWSVQNPLPNGLGAVLPASGNTATIPAFNGLTNNTNQPISFTISASASTSGNAVCPGAPLNYTITVNPTAIASASFVSNDTICNNTQVSITLSSTTPNVQFTWTVSAPNGVSGAAPSGAASASIQQTLTNANASIALVTYTVTPQLGNCNGTVLAVPVYVNPVAVMSAMNNLTSCPGQPITPPAFGSVPAPSTFAWSNSNTAVGLNAAGSNNIPSWNAPVNNGVANITSTVTVTPTYNGCVGTPSNFTVTIYPTPIITTSPMNQTVCEGVATSAITFTSNLAGSTFAWNYGTAGANLSGFNNGNGSNPLPSMTIAHAGNSPQTVTYSVVPTSANNCSGPSSTYTITVNPNPTIGGVVDQVICSGTSTTLSNYTNNVAGGGFTWNLLNVNIPNTVTGFLAPSGSGQLAAASIANSGTQPYALNYLITPNATGCTGVPDTLSITVMPAPAIQFSGGPSQALCSGQSSVSVNMTSATPNVIWSWTVTSSNNVSGANPASGNSATIPSFNLTQNTNTPQTVIISAQANTTNGGCQGAASTYTITVNPIPTVTPTVSPSNTICSGGNITLNLTSNVANATFAWTSNATAGITGNTNNSGSTITNTLVNATAAAGTVTYSIIPSANACSGNAVTSTITVNPVAQMSGLTNISVCPGANIAPPAFQSIPQGASFTWTNSNTNIGIGASGQGNLVPWNAPVNNTANSIVGLVIITPTIGNACAGVNDTIVVTIYPTPQITNAVLQQTLCEGTASSPVNITSNLAGSTLSWSFATAGGGLSGHPIGNGNNPIPSITFSNNLATQQTAQYTLSASSVHQCQSAPVTYTFNVNPIPNLNNPGGQTVCSGIPTVPASFTADVQGTNFTWTAITPPAGLTGFTASGSGTMGAMTITNSTANPLQLVYSVTPNAAGCSGSPMNYIITVNPSPTVVFSTGNQTICSGAATALVNLTSTTNNATISWNASVPGGIQGVNTLSGSTQIPAFTLTNNTQGNLTATFTAIASTAGGTVCPGVAATHTITVSPQNGITVTAVDSSLCSGASAQISISSNTAGLTYATSAAASQGITGAANANGAQFSQQLTNSGVSQGTVTYTVVATAPPGSSCPNQTAVLPITIEPVATVQYSIPSQSLCSGSSSQIINLSSNVAGATISWNATLPNGVGGLPAQGNNSIPASAITTNLNASAIINLVASASINTCTGPFANGQITVFPNPGLTITPPNDTICSGVAAVASLTSNVANTTFAWTISSNPSIVGASNGTGATINQVLTNNSAQIQQLTYNVTTNGPGPNNGCAGQSSAYNVWVNPVASVGFSQANATICSGTTSTAVNITSSTPNAQISWTANIPAGITGAVASGMNTIPAQTLVNNTQGPLTVVYSVNVATQVGNCQGQASTYSITVNPIPVLSFSQNTQVICSGVNTTAVGLQSNLNAGIPGTLNYSWSANQPVGISGMATSGTNTIPVQTLTNNSAAPITLNYVATLNYTNNGMVCNGTGGTYTITVNPLPQVTAIIQQPIICSNDTASICFTTPVAGANFNWTVVASNGISGAQNGTGACLNQVLVNNLLTQGTVVYTVVASANNCSGSPVTATISVNPNPSVTQVANIVVCPGQAIPTVNFTSTPAGASFAWTNSNPNIGLGASGAGSVPGWQAPVNLSGAPFVGTISVNGTLNGCSGANMTFTVTINPTPTLTVSPASITMCSGSNAVISCNSNVLNATMTWVEASTNASGAANGNGSAVNGLFTISQTLTATSNVQGNVVYTITPSALGCVGTPQQVGVTVNPIPTVSVNPGSQTICSGSTTSIVLSGNMQGISYGWTVSNNNNIVGAITGSNDSIVQLLTNTSTGVQQVTYTVTPSLNGCIGAGVNVIVTVNPTPLLTTVVANNTICSGTSTNIALNSNVLNTTYAYTANPSGGVVGAGSGIANPIVQQLTNNTLNPGQVTYIITPTANSCDGAPVSVTITVNPVATVNSNPNSVTICSGQNANVQLSSSSQGATFNWTVSANPQLTGQAAGSGPLINQQITNATFVVQNYYYVVTPVFGVCPGLQDTIPVTVNPLPQIFPGATVNTCASTPPFNLTGFSPAGGTWSGTGITNGQLATFSPAVSGVGSFTLTYSYTDPITGCINSATRTVNVNPLPVPLFTMDTLKCTNTTVSIVNNSTGASTYFWNFGNGATSTQMNPIYQFPAAGNYTVWLTATSPQGCVDSISHNIQIVTTPTASFVPNPNSGCGPLSVNFNNTSTGYSITSYFWNFGFPANGPFSNAQNPGAVTFQPPLIQDTNYVVSLSVTNLCGTTNYLDTILVHPLPIASFATTVNTGCSPLPVGFQNLSLGSPTNYIWNFGDGFFSTSVNPTHTFTYGPNDTIFNIALIAINPCGSDTAYFPIHVFPNTVTSFFNTNPTVGCAPLNVQFTNYSQGGSLNYFWSFGNGQVSNAQSPSHLYTSSGTYVAQLVVDNGCSFDTSDITITVLPKPQVAFSIVDDTLCMGQAFQFTNLSSQLSNTVWTFGDGDTSLLYNPTHIYASAGNFMVMLVGTSAANGCVDTAFRPVTSIPSPVLNYDTLLYEGCATLGVSFNELSGTATSAVWDYGDGNIGIAPSSSYFYTNAGTFYPEVVAQNAFGCTDTANFTVVVHDVPIADFDVLDKTSCDVPFQVTPVNLSQGALVYNWIFGNGSTSNQFEPTATYTQSGSYNMVLMAYNQFGCGDTTVQTIIVHPIPEALFVPDTTIGCEDLTIYFTNNSTNSNAYLWNFGDGASIQAPNPIHTYTEPGIYTVSLIVSNPQGCLDTLIQTNLIQVLQRPLAGFTVFPSIIYTEDPFLQLNNSAQNYNTGEYYMGNGAVVDIYTTQYNYGITDPGQYMISQVVYNNLGCSDTAEAYIQILATPTLYVPNAFTPDSDGENDFWIPVATAMYSIEVSVFNRWGEEVFRTTDLAKTWDGRYNGKDCPVGVYSWKIMARDVNQELIIQSGHISLLR